MTTAMWRLFSSTRASRVNVRDASNSSSVSVSEEQVRRCLHTLALLQGRHALDLPIARVAEV